LSGLRQMIRRVYRRCGFPARWTGVHRLRHSFATRLFRHGADPKQIADLLGHRGLGSTDTYPTTHCASNRALSIRPYTGLRSANGCAPNGAKPKVAGKPNSMTLPRQVRSN
jgi:integrase/recombinase XerC